MQTPKQDIAVYRSQPITAHKSYAAYLFSLTSRWTFVHLTLRTAAQLLCAKRYR